VPVSPPTVAATPTGASTDWLALGAASRLLGVDPDTLRRWADEGRVEAFTTPGGHRRFARRSLERVVATRRTGPTGRLRALGATTDRVSAVYRRRYEVPARGAPDPRSSVPATEHDAYREQGRLLVAALLAHLDAPTAAARDRAAQEALELTADLGRRLAAMGMPLGEAVAMFVSARRPFLTELGALARRRELDAARLSTLYDAATAVLDRLLLRLIASHSAAAPTPPGAAASTPSARTPR
jgi:excisionase family DNA binding protein